MSWSELASAVATTVRHSPLETARFGLDVDRAVAPDARASPDEDVCRVVARSQADVVVLRYPADRVALPAALVLTGRVVVPADVLVYWRLPVDLTASAVPGLSTTVEADLPPAEVADLVGDVFAGYTNHYAANPLLGAAAALEGYVEWATSSVVSSAPVVTRRDGSAVALATLAEGVGHVEVELAGVRAAARGRGVYAHLLAGVAAASRSAGAAELVISTQVHNTGVQRAWARVGGEPLAAYTTVHLVRRGLLGA